MDAEVSSAPAYSQVADSLVEHFKNSLALTAAPASGGSTDGNRSFHDLVLAVCNASLSNDADMLSLLRQLHARLHESKPSRQLFQHGQGIPFIIHTMTMNPSNLDLQVMCCAILTSFSIDTDGSAEIEIGENGGIQAITNLGDAFPGSLPALQAAVQSLRALCIPKQNRAMMIQHGVFELVISALKDHIDNETLVESTLVVLAGVVFGNSEARLAFGLFRGVHFLTKVLSFHESSASVQIYGSLALRNLAHECPTNVSRMIDADTIDVLFKSLQSHSQNEEVASQCLAAVGNMVLDNGQARMMVLSNNTHMKLLFTWLKVFIECGVISKTISDILRNLCKEGGSPEQSSASPIAGICAQEDGASAIISAFERAFTRSDCPSMLSLASLVQLLCVEEEFRQKAGEARGVPIFMQILAHHSADEELIGAALEALCSMLTGNDDNKIKFSKLGGITAVVSVMSKHMTNQFICEKGCKALDMAAEGETVSTAQLVVDRETPAEAIKIALANFPHDARLQEYSFSVLIKFANLGTTDSSALKGCGFPALVSVAIRTHADNPCVQSLGNQLLALLNSDGGRGGRSSSRDKRSGSSARFRSRSRTMGERSQSRNDKSKSPTRDRSLRAGRQAMRDAMKAFEDEASGLRGTAVRNRSATGMMLEPVVE